MLNKQKIAANFSRSAASYDAHALLQQKMQSMVFNAVAGDYADILDIGCGTGSLVEQMAIRWPNSKIWGIDLAPGMIEYARAIRGREKKTFMVADAQYLPFEDKFFDLVVASASLHWMDYKKVFCEITRVLKKTGNFVFATFGPMTLDELRQAGLSVNTFPAKDILEKELQPYFKNVSIYREVEQVSYPDVFSVIDYLKKIGAQTPETVSGKGLLTAHKLKNLFPKNEQGLKCSFEILFGRCKG